MKKNRNTDRTIRVVKANTPDEVLWKEFWADKTLEEKLNLTEEIIRGKNASSRLQRVFRIVERTAS